MAPLLTAAFFSSGASALIFEILWFRQAGLAFGNSIWASSLVLSAFMGGLALGNALAAWIGPRVANPVRAYAYHGSSHRTDRRRPGLSLSVWARRWRPSSDRCSISRGRSIRCGCWSPSSCCSSPSTAMGITLPLLSRQSRTGSGIRDRDPKGSGFANPESRIPVPVVWPRARWLYGWNTLGAMAGVVAGEMFLVGRFGVRGTALAAGALNLLAAAIAGLLAGWCRGRGTGVSTTRPEPLLRGPGIKWLVATFAAGFALLALEVIWFRFLLLFVKGHSNAFAVMLGVVLAGIALGGLAASLWLRFESDAYRFAAPRRISGSRGDRRLVCALSVGDRAVRPVVDHGARRDPSRQPAADAARVVRLRDVLSARRRRSATWSRV